MPRTSSSMSSSSSKSDVKEVKIFEAIKTLRESSNDEEKCKALTCVQSIASKSGALDFLSETQSSELCKLVVNTSINSDDDVLYSKANSALAVFLHCCRNRKINLFNELMNVNRENRLKIFKVFNGVSDETMKAISRDKLIVNFIKDCLKFVTPEVMGWLAPNACTDNINVLKDAEGKTLTKDEEIEEQIIGCVFNFLYRLYRLSTSSSYADCAKFNILFMDKVATLAYMGHKRQRAPAIKVLQLPEMGNHIRTSAPTIWQEYKSVLQNTYCQRMTVLVTTCEPDWSVLWTTSIQLLGTDLHRGAGLINNLLSVEERAFKSVDTVVRRQAFLSWKLIIDNFALDEQELATARRVKLLCIPLNAKNSKTETMTLTKLEVWWHLIYKLYNHIEKFTNPVLNQFLNFCFGPLGDTPLLSSKFNVIASPGKRFYKTKLVAIDALLQLLTDDKDSLRTVKSSLEEKIPVPISSNVFQECYKTFIHCTGEAILALAQLNQKELDTKRQIIAVLWKALFARVKSVEDEAAKIQMYKEIMLLIVELGDHVDNLIIRESLLESILPNMDEFPTNSVLNSETVINLMGVFMKPAILNKINGKQHDLIKRMLWQGIIKSSDTITSYVPNALEVFKTHVRSFNSIEPDTKNVMGLSVLWTILCDMMTKYMIDGQEINEGDAASHDFTTVQSLIKFPFTSQFSPEFWQIKRVAVAWKALYKQFDLQVNLVPTVKPNEFVSFTIAVIQDGIQLDKRCVGFAISCLDEILITMNYKHALDEDGFLPIVKLINDLCVLNLTNGKTKNSESVLRELSSVLITLYGHVPKKVASCLEAVCPAIENMLKPCKDESLVKEIASTWETVMNIFKGLGTSMSPNVIVSFQDAIRLALRHEEPDIVSQTLFCLESEVYKTGPIKDLVEKLLKEIDLAKIKERPVTSASVENGDKLITKPTKLSSSFLSRNIASPKPTVANEKSKAERRSQFFPDPESQDYVLIKSDFRFDVNRLTEHQKESLLRRREDIPALYNDLSQSCSQDTQNIQEWFDKKKDEIVGRNSSINSNGDNVPAMDGQNMDVGDANKENKLESDPATTMICETSSKDKLKELESSDKNEKQETLRNSKNTSTNEILSPTIENQDNLECNQLQAKKLDFESRTEFPENKSSHQKLSEVPSTSQSSEVVEEGPFKHKEIKRGVKRKASGSDSDSEENISPSRRRRRFVNDFQSDSDSSKSIESDGAMKQLSKRTKNEMTRLQINMVFDNKLFSTLPSRRRSKVNQEGDCEVRTDRSSSSEKTKSIRNRSPRTKDEEKVKKLTWKPKLIKKRGRRRTRAAAQAKQLAENTPPNSSKSCTIISRTEHATNENPDVQESVKLKHEVTDSKNDKEVQQSIGESDTEENTDNSDEIVESSQGSTNNELTSLDKKYTNKQCFIRINKMQSLQPGQTIELDIGNEKTKIMKGCDPNSPFKVCTTEITDADTPKKHAAKPAVAIKSAENEQVLSSGSAPPPLLAPETKQNEISVVSEVNSSLPEPKLPQTDVSTSPDRVPSSLLNSCSPKNCIKRYSKLKSVTPQGRAAHMLGLVTKQALAETRPNISSEDDISTNSKRVKEGEEELPAVRKERFILKEPERLGSPSGSRQEKIFNKMRTASDNDEVLPQTTLSHFSNLKNDGEKLSLVKNAERKRITVETTPITQSDKVREKIDEENMSANQDRETLPMLEWSSANPPSLTASPSTSILKRQRQMQIENDPDSLAVACKRKRVSFADPPVSMEMGYEITASTPPHRMSKVPSASRIFFPRKDSPVRLKQTKLVAFQTSPGRSDKESQMEIDKSTDLSNSQTNEILIDNDSTSKVTENSEIAVTNSPKTKNQCSDNVENNSDNQKLLPQHGNDSARVMLDDLAREIEISAGSRDVRCKDKNTDVIMIKEVNTPGKPMSQETETQQDIFESVNVAAVNDNYCKSSKTNIKTTKSRTKTSLDESGLRCVDINILTNPSAIEENVVRTDSSSVEVLEDTVDIQNVTGLNTTTNSEEIFCSKLIKTSTQTSEARNLAESDTLTVTDSVFSNLPFSQNSQNTNDTMDLDQPELLDSTKLIYPSMAESSVPIDSVIEYLADPLWKPHLSNYLHSKGIETVGNLAQLTEREVNWIPVKRSPKVPFVRDVLMRFEKSVINLPSIGSTNNDSSQASLATTPNTSMSILPPSSTPIPRTPNEIAAGNLTNEFIVRPERVTKSTETQVSVVDLLDEIDASVVLKSAIKRCSAENILANYKLKMKNMAEEDLERETIKMLGIELKHNADAHLKSACRTSGLGKVLGRLPDIFNNDRQFFAKVLATYRRKLKVADCMQGLDFEEVKSAVRQRCTSSDLAEMLSKKLKDEEKLGVTTPMTELSSLQAMLKRMPKDLIISHTVANEELISPLVVLDIALQNNTPADISFALAGQSNALKSRIFSNLCNIEALTAQIEQRSLPNETLSELLKVISRKLEPTELLDSFNEIMKEKFIR